MLSESIRALMEKEGLVNDSSPKFQAKSYKDIVLSIGKLAFCALNNFLKRNACRTRGTSTEEIVKQAIAYIEPVRSNKPQTATTLGRERL